MNIKWIETFIVAAKYENFRRASEELFLTQPAITKHIKKLEEYLNIKLFERNGKAIYLSPAGHKFLPYAQEIMMTFDTELDEFEGWKQGYKRKLTIAAAPQIASSILPRVLREFMDQNPDIEVFINVLKSYKIGKEISVGRADIGLSRIKPIQTNIDCRAIHEDSVIFVAPPNDGIIYDEKMILEKYKLITHNHPDYWDTLLNDIKRNYPSIRTMKVNQIEITKKFIEQGLGISLLPYTMVKKELETKKLLEINPDKINLPFSFTYLLTKVKTEEAEILTGFLKEEFKKYQ